MGSGIDEKMLKRDELATQLASISAAALTKEGDGHLLVARIQTCNSPLSRCLASEVGCSSAHQLPSGCFPETLSARVFLDGRNTRRPANLVLYALGPDILGRSDSLTLQLGAGTR